MPPPVLPISQQTADECIRLAAEKLRAGRLVALPTETVYGIAGLLNHPHAVALLRQFRSASGAGDTGPFTPHLGDPVEAESFLSPLNNFGKRCIGKLWPGPVALIFDVPPDRQTEVAKSLNVAPSDLYSDGTITLRCPAHDQTAEILRLAQGPVGIVRAPSSQGADGTTVASQLDDRVELVIDSGPPRFSKPSTILHVRADSYDIVRSGIYDRRIIEKLLQTTILFVCSGNTCRSPMAEAIARQVLSQKMGVPEVDLEKKGVNVLSAGVMAFPGARATSAAVEAVREMGADLSRHRSRPLTVEIIHQADMIFTMGQSHARVVKAMVPSASEKVQTLSPNGDIEDPIGSDVSVYKHLAGELRDLIEKRLQEKVLY